MISIVSKIRDKYPTPLGETHASFLLELAREIGNEAGLLKKTSGTKIKLPDGTNVAQDIICYPNGDIFDVLVDGEGEAKPTWRNAGVVPTNRYYKVAPLEPSPVPKPPEPPVVDVTEKFFERLRETLDPVRIAVISLTLEIKKLREEGVKIRWF